MSMSRNNWLHLLIIVVVSVAALAAGPATAQTRPSRGASVPDELIVKLAPGADPHRFAAGAGMALHVDGQHKVPGRAIYRFTIIDGSTPAGKAAAVAGRAGVIYAEPNYLGQVPQAQKRSSWVVSAGESEYAAQWAAERIALTKAHAVSRGAGVTVAILDTGVDLNHPALVGHIVPGYDFVDGDDSPEEEVLAEAEAYSDEEDDADFDSSANSAETDSSDSSDSADSADSADDSAPSAYGHGTHVAGLVALVAPEAAIMPLRTLDSDGSGDLWTQVLALRYAAYRGADVINLSFSFGEHSTLFDDVVAEVTCTAKGFVDCRSSRRPGAVVVAAAGNSGTSVRQWPAASTLPGILAVAASTEQDTLADFSSYGAWVPLAAPGDRVLSAVPSGGYEAWSGTSMAAPLTAGVSALVRATSPGLPPAEVIRRIVGSAAIIDTPVKRRLDAAAAVAPTVATP
jgi:subtilisin family serine protease